jgi:hypothetical protein
LTSWRDAVKSETVNIIRDKFDGDIAAFVLAMKRRGKERKKVALAPIKKEYNRWRAMLRRCNDPSADSYASYGAKGVKVCDRWLNFDHFLADMGVAPGPEYSIDRIDSKGNYEPANCRWATAVQQVENRDTKPPKGTVTLINGKWRGQARVNGMAASKYFADKESAAIWAEAKSLELAAM